jgi:quercetin dioxygenase-like cupin family protein
MIETVFYLTKSNDKTIEKVIQDENIHYLHMILNQGEGLPDHITNANVYMTTIKGTLSLSLNEEETQVYEAGTVLKIPIQTMMKARNEHADTLELIVVKAPTPKNQ